MTHAPGLRRRVLSPPWVALFLLEISDPPAYSGGVERRWRLIVVRPTYPAVLQGILQNPDRWPERSAVMIDRRYAERRVRVQQVALERRRGPRRREPDAMWYTHGFIVVETDELPTQATRLDNLRG